MRTMSYAVAASMAVAMAGGASAQQAATGAPAAQPADTGGSGLGEILVTARKQSENLQSTPISITAFGSKNLEEHRIIGINDLQSQTPSLNLAPATSDPLSAIIGIRGQIQSDTLLGLQPSVGIYFDGVYYGQTTGSALATLEDIDRVEVLKGPQGTLYGRNTTGGAITIYSKLPTDHFEASLRLGAGDYDQKEVAGMVNIPLGTDGVTALRVVGSYRRNDGYSRDIVHDKLLGSSHTGTIRATLRAQPNDRFEMLLRADYSDAADSGSRNQPSYIEPGSLGLAEISAEMFGAANAFDPANLAAAQAAYQHYVDLGASGKTFAYDTAERNSARTYGVSATETYDFSDAVNLKSITAYRHIKRIYLLDLDASPYAIANGFGNTQAEQFTQEFNLNGKSLDNKLTWILGAFYFHASGTELGLNNALPAFNPTNPSANDSAVTNESEAVFAQATYEILPGLRFTGGLRYTHDKERLVSRSHDAFNCQVEPSALTGPQCIGLFQTSANNVSYTAGIDYKIGRIMVYAKTSKGFKGGGINQRGSAVEGSFAAFRPEKVTDYEVGAKASFLDNHLRTDLALFRSNYRDVQRTVIAIGPGGNPNTIVQNAASARIQGAELAVDVVPFRNAELHATGSYTDAKYLRFVDGLGTDLSSSPFLLLPKWTYSLDGEYTVPTSVGDFHGSLNWHWQSKEATSIQLPFALTPLAQQRAFGLLDARVSFKPESVHGLEIAFWMKNIANKLYRTQTLDLSPTPLGAVYQYLGPPRTFGGTVSMSF